MRTLLILALLSSGAATAAAQTIGAGRGENSQCVRTAVDRIASYGVSREQLSLISLDRARTQEGVVQGYFVWFEMAGCDGTVVVELTSRCHPVQAYTRGRCRIKGVSSSC